MCVGDQLTILSQKCANWSPSELKLVEQWDWTFLDIFTKGSSLCSCFSLSASSDFTQDIPFLIMGTLALFTSHTYPKCNLFDFLLKVLMSLCMQGAFLTSEWKFNYFHFIHDAVNSFSVVKCNILFAK